MTLMLVTLGVLAGIVLLVTLIGLMLPADHVVSRTLQLRRQPPEVWKVIRDFEMMGSWHPDLTAVRRLPDRNGHEVWEETYGRNMVIPLETVLEDPQRRLVRRIADDGLAFGGEWVYVITPATNGGCQLTLTERGTVRNPVFRFLSRFIIGHESTIETYLKALAEHFGEPSAIRG